jgi:protease I
MVIAALATDGVEQVELTEPKQALERAGATVELISIKPGKIQGFNHLDKADTFPVKRVVDDVAARQYDALVLPGGVANPDQLRMHPGAVHFVREFFAHKKPVGAICHAPWLLVEADAVRHRTLTSWPSLRTDILNAGGNWVDQEVVEDGNLVTSRKPADLPAFCARLVEVFGSQRSAGRTGAAERAAQPADGAAPAERRGKIDQAGVESFPASDAPSSLQTT